MTATALREEAGLTDAALVARVARGDLDALGTLFERYHDDVRRFLTRLGAASDLDDVVQLSFLELLTASRNFDGRCSARTWLLGVSATMLRRQRRSLARMAVRLGALVAMGTAAKAETPSEIAEGHEAEARFHRGLMALSPKKREVFVMVVLEGVSGEDAAAALDTPLNTIWTRLHHARRELREALAEELP